ncbi:hypothetical protein [Gottschalkia purinilytica]|nr:hypothetical protein [Gottschalkia purinilytica]
MSVLSFIIGIYLKSSEIIAISIVFLLYYILFSLFTVVFPLRAIFLIACLLTVNYLESKGILN